MKSSCSNFIVILILLFTYNNGINGLEYSAQEKEILVQFRQLTNDNLYREYMKSDPYLIRWLRARNLNMHDAAKMLRIALKWRKDNKIDDILEESIHDFQASPFYIDGVDYEGSIINTFIASRVDLRAALLAGKRADVIRYWDQFMERGETETLRKLGLLGNDSEIVGPKGHLATIILDASGYNRRQHACLACIDVYIEWLRHADNYYPGYLKHLIVINAPRIVVPLIQVLKSIMASATSDVLQVFGPNKNDWMPVLLKIVPPDQLRVNFGGTKKDLL